MLVNDVLNLVATLSIGLDNPTDNDKQIFLKYLNLAHFKVCQETALINPNVSIQSDILDVNNGVVDDLTAPLLSFRSVYNADSNIPLSSYPYDRILKKDPALKITGSPVYYYFINKKLNVWPLITQTQLIGVRYNTIPSIFNINDDLSPLYPELYHPVFIDGTAYYIFQGESGFKNETKMLMAQKEWLKGKADLFNYFRILSGNSIYSTYSAI